MLLNNFGNTCYINTIIQLFINNTQFMTYIKRKDYPEEYLLDIIKNIDTSSNLRKFLICLQEKIGDSIKINEQNDASEIYVKILDIFEQEDENSVSFFTGIHRKTYICTRCMNKREKSENFTSLNLYITTESNNLQKSLMRIFDKEMLDNVECEVCQAGTKTEVKNKITKWPKNLIFLINRYHIDYKINIDFDYTRHIELLLNSTVNKYSLTGIINHIGAKDIGHYTYIKISNSSCTEISDDKVRQIVNFKSPMNYMLIYVCKLT